MRNGRAHWRIPDKLKLFEVFVNRPEDETPPRREERGAGPDISAGEVNDGARGMKDFREEGMEGSDPEHGSRHRVRAGHGAAGAGRTQRLAGGRVLALFSPRGTMSMPRTGWTSGRRGRAGGGAWWGDAGGEPVVASPLYKQRYALMDGRCLDDPPRVSPAGRCDRDGALSGYNWSGRAAHIVDIKDHRACPVIFVRKSTILHEAMAGKRFSEIMDKRL